MCEPATIAMMALSAAGGVMQQQAAVSAAKAQNAQYEANAKNAQKAMLQDAEQLNQRQAQEAEAAAQEKFRLEQEALKATGKAATSAGEAGVAGASVQRLMDSFERDKLTNQGTINRNLEMTTRQIATQRDSLMTTYESRKNSVQKGSAPSAGLAALQIGTSAAAAGLSTKSGQEAFKKWWG